MNKGIVVCSWHENYGTWLRDCLDSIEPTFKPYVHVNRPGTDFYEAGAIHAGYSMFDEFWVIQDTVVVKDILTVIYALKDTGRSYSAGPRFICCLGKIRREIIDQIGLPPTPKNKFDSATLVEDLWFRKYMEAEPDFVIMDKNFNDRQVFEERHGRQNMVLESSTFRKYKGTWSLGMIKGVTCPVSGERCDCLPGSVSEAHCLADVNA